MSTITKVEDCSVEFLCQYRMEETGKVDTSPILTLTLSPQSDNVNLISNSASDHCESPHYLIANTPPYSPAFARFNFFPPTPTSLSPSDSRMTSYSIGRRRLSRFQRLITYYAKYGMVFCLLFTCLLFLETSPNDTLSNRSPNSERTLKLDENSPRLRRALSVPIADQSANMIRDGPLFDLGSGYAASRGEDVLITVKTSKKYHVSRLNDILDTWFRLAPEQIYFITDADDENLNARTGGRLIQTRCPAGHNRQALCCKQSEEYETYLKHQKSWWCHFDDDNYVNIPQLMRTLSQYDPREDWYLGKPSTKGPIETQYRDYGPNPDFLNSNERISFWFATGGAGFCVSKSLAMKMRPYAADGKFMTLCDRIRLPDDVTIGYLIEVLLEKNLTVVPRFHSHLENMRSIDLDRLHEQVTLSAGSYDGRDRNLVNVERYFTDKDDPRRFRSLHCHLYPMAAVCRTRKQMDNSAKQIAS